MKKKKPVKVKPQSKRQPPKEQIVIETPSFHECFPLTLVHKDGKEEKVCYFVCQEHLDKYITRYKLNKKDYTISETKERKRNNEVQNI
jgi:hypothetical protein